MRIGHGYDVHRLIFGRKLVIGGVLIPYEKGLDGHSDADVLTHALMDAMLGAAGLGDIGRCFPDTDDQYAGADSMDLLRRVNSMLKEKGYMLHNADITVIAQSPQMAPFIQTMEEKITACLNVQKGSVNVKATTEEHLGFTGSGDGIACHAVCTIVSVT